MNPGLNGLWHLSISRLLGNLWYATGTEAEHGDLVSMKFCKVYVHFESHTKCASCLVKYCEQGSHRHGQACYNIIT